MRWLSRLKAAFDSEPPADAARWIMLDVETSGLNAQRDRLLAIAAIAMRVNWREKTLTVELGDSFEVFLQQDEVSSNENILLHGIGAQKQRDGTPPAQALSSFAAFVGESPLLAFHAAFDQRMIERYARRWLGRELANHWLDIDHLCAVTHEHVGARALDDWLEHFSIECRVRHQAAADTLAECELLQRVWPRVSKQCSSWRDVERLAAQHRWIARPS